MKRRVGFSAFFFVACVFVAVGSIIPFAFGQVDPDRIDRKALGQPALSGGEVHPSPPKQILNERKIEVPDSPKVVHLWEEQQADGSQATFYSVGYSKEEDAADRPVGRARRADYTIPLRLASFDPLLDAPPANMPLQSVSGNELFLMQFWTVPLEEFREQIEAMGGRIHRYLPENTYLVRMPVGMTFRAEQLPYVRWVGEFHPAYKLDEAILKAYVNGLEAVEGAQEALGEFYTKYEYSIEVFERAGGRPVIRQAEERGDDGMVLSTESGTQQVSEGLGQQAVVKKAIEAMGGRVNAVTPGGFRIQVSLTMDQLIKVARMNEVHFIEPWGFGGTDMNIVRGIGGANFIESTLGFTGEGVRAEVFDSEVRTTHTEFTSLVPTLHSSDAGDQTNPHGTSVYSHMFARGASASARGLLPDAERGYFYDRSESTQFGGMETRLQIASDLISSFGPVSQAVLQTSSVGNTRTKTYTPISSEMDDVIFQTGLLHVQSQSNAANDPGWDPQDSRPQAWAKNIVSVGAVNHYNTTTRTDDTWVGDGTGCTGTTGTSVGPAEDGRIKPDLCFFYDCTYAAYNGWPPPYSDTAYTQFGGTSGATPSVAGYMGLFHQMWHENTWDGSGMLTFGTGSVFGNRPKAMLAKAALINTADRYDWTPGTSWTSPGSIDRYVQGWGMPNLETLYDTRHKTFYVNESHLLQQGESKGHVIEVAAGEPQLNVTMVYMDPPGTTSSTQHRINALSLRVTSPDGTLYPGNNGLTGGNESTPGGSSNTRDTVENVFIPDPEAGRWCVEILADTVVQDAHTETAAVDADYALWVTGGVESGSLKTTYRAGNGQDGAMFDISAHEPVTITGFDFSHTSTSQVDIEVYYTPGGYSGNESNPSAWTLLGSDTVQPSGSGVAAFVDIGGLTIESGETYGIYITDEAVSGSMLYTDGSESFDNGEILIQTGLGIEYPFGPTYSPRTWNGSVYYRAYSTGPFAYSIRSNDDDRLYRIDLRTGVAKPMGDPMSFGDAEGMTIGPRGTVYAIGGTVDELWNVGSPPGALIGPTGSRDGIDAGLDYYDGVLYNLNGGSGVSTLYRVNRHNGNAIAVGSTSTFLDGLAINRDGRAFGTDWTITDSLYEVDLETGSVTLVGSLGLGNVSKQSGLAFLGGTLYALTSEGKIYTIDTSTGSASFVTNVTNDGCGSATLDGWEGLAIPPCSGAVPTELEPFDVTYSSSNYTRGYWFTAPTDFLVYGLRVPDEANEGVQNVEVVRFEDGNPPPHYSDSVAVQASADAVHTDGADATTNAFVSLFRRTGVTDNSIIPTAIPVREGDVIGILGAAGTLTMRNSYASSNEYTTNILGRLVTLKRLGMQHNLNSMPARDLFTEDTAPFSRVEMYYIKQPHIVLDADTVGTGSTIDSVPLHTRFGTINAVGTVEIRDTADPDLAAAGSVGDVFDIINAPSSKAEIFFDFDVESITFVYGGNWGGIVVEARDAGGAAVDSFVQTDTSDEEPAGPQTLSGSGIRSLHWEDPQGGSFAPLDNICILTPQGPSIVSPLLLLLLDE